jgi:signal transduction histidine kinase
MSGVNSPTNMTTSQPSELSKPAQRAVLLLRPEHWLALALLALHGALAVEELRHLLARALLLTHFGFFLIWQPLWRSDQKLILGQVILIVGTAVLLVVADSWWLMALWVAVLLSLVGGNVPGMKNFGQRLVSLLAAVYLFSVLLGWVVPHLFEDQYFPSALEFVVRYLLVIPVLAIFLVPTGKQTTSATYSVDLFYSLLLFLLVVVLVLGAFVLREVGDGNYVLALTQTLFIIAGLLVVLSRLWDPRAGFAGIGQLLTRYFLSMGVPFERWMHSLAELAERERDPDKFAVVACHEMSGLPWLAGVRWQSRQSKGVAGEETRHPTEFEFGGLTMIFYTQWSASPALMLHMRLLARLLGDYYDAKQREQEQRQNAYVQAIYETGARLTHDVKNLLQTLRSLCSAAETSSEADADAVRLLMQRQLPQIAQRLQITLDKLNTKPPEGLDKISGAQWWQALRQRYAHERIEFEAGALPEDAMLPSEVFESVAENLLQNALEKKKLESRLRILVRLQWDKGFVLSVCDDGKPVPEAIAARLFASAVPSHNGLGVGIYQAGRFARQHEFDLSLASNEPGRVCFALARAPAT